MGTSSEADHMTSAATPMTAVRRLLDPSTVGTSAAGPGRVPELSLPSLLAAVEASGLSGRGGAGFPTSIKVRAVAAGRRRPVVVANAMEGEPLSYKDAVLLDRNPALVLDGLEIVGRAVRCRRSILAVHEDTDTEAVEVALRGRRVELARLGGGFVAGQESALVNQLNGRAPLPGDQFRRVTEIGVDGRPTLVLNAETLAHLALVARHGPAWFRSAGLADDPGTSLFTVTGSVRRPGVVEAARGTRLADVIESAVPVEPQAVLVGGYHGGWVPARDLDVRLTKLDLAPYRAAVGAGVLHVLGADLCPLDVAEQVVTYLAAESARQCGPCVNGLPRLASTLHRLASCARDDSLPRELDRIAQVVSGRGACAHPDGTARFVGSTLDAFHEHVEEHLRGRCPHDRGARR
jgi:NADH:ubiquinone oxidoreductase subunit F (NADH-binding)